MTEPSVDNNERGSEPMTLFWDIDGKTLPDVLTWAGLYEDDAYRQLLLCEWPDGVMVSTVWIGFNWSPSLMTDFPVSCFASAIIDRRKPAPLRIVEERYAPTKEAAWSDFAALVEQVLMSAESVEHGRV
jgi:hypothetical protein